MSDFYEEPPDNTDWIVFEPARTEARPNSSLGRGMAIGMVTMAAQVTGSDWSYDKGRELRGMPVIVSGEVSDGTIIDGVVVLSKPSATSYERDIVFNGTLDSDEQKELLKGTKLNPSWSTRVHGNPVETFNSQGNADARQKPNMLKAAFFGLVTELSAGLYIDSAAQQFRDEHLPRTLQHDPVGFGESLLALGANAMPLVTLAGSVALPYLGYRHVRNRREDKRTEHTKAIQARVIGEGEAKGGITVPNERIKFNLTLVDVTEHGIVLEDIVTSDQSAKGLEVTTFDELVQVDFQPGTYLQTLLASASKPAEFWYKYLMPGAIGMVDIISQYNPAKAASSKQHALYQETGQKSDRLEAADAALIAVEQAIVSQIVNLQSLKKIYDHDRIIQSILNKAEQQMSIQYTELDVLRRVAYQKLPLLDPGKPESLKLARLVEKFFDKIAAAKPEGEDMEAIYAGFTEKYGAKLEELTLKVNQDDEKVEKPGEDDGDGAQPFLPAWEEVNVMLGKNRANFTQ